jgi:hypothetical protein
MAIPILNQLQPNKNVLGYQEAKFSPCNTQILSNTVLEVSRNQPKVGLVTTRLIDLADFLSNILLRYFQSTLLQVFKFLIPNIDNVSEIIFVFCGMQQSIKIPTSASAPLDVHLMLSSHVPFFQMCASLFPNFPFLFPK